MDFRKFFQWIKVVFRAGIPILHMNNKYYKKFKKNPEKYSVEYRREKINWIITRLTSSFNTYYIIEDYEKYEQLKDKCLLTSNHLSDMDPLILMNCSKRPMTFVSKKENMDKVVIGNILSALEAIPLDRDNVMNQINQIKQIVNEIKNEERPDVCIYVEGTRNRHPENHCLEFHAGSFKMAYMANSPIVPVVTYGTFRILSTHSWLKRYPVFIKFLDPIYPEDYKNLTTVELAEKVQKLVDDEVDKMRKRDYEELKKQKLSRKRFLKETAVDGIKD